MIVWLAAAAVMVAADGAVAPGSSETVLQAEVDALPGEPLELGEAVRLGLEESPTVLQAVAGLRAARGALRREKGLYDPVLFAEWMRLDAETPTASPFSGAEVLDTDTRTLSAGARLRLPLGTELSAILESTRLESNSAFTALDPEYTASGRLEVRQPLLKGFGPATNVGVSSSARELDAARARADDARRAASSEVEAAYWTLHSAERDLAVRRLLVKAGEALVDKATSRAKAGLAGPGEVATGQLFLSEQRSEALAAEERLAAASDDLASQIGRRPAQGAYRAVTPPPTDFAVEAETVVLERAAAANDELAAAAADLAAARSRVKAAGWDRLPRLDLVGSLGGNGLAGTPHPVTFLDTTYVVDESGGLGDAASEAASRDFPTWSVGMTFELPLFFREGSGERERLLGELDRAQARHEALRRSLDDRVRARHREVVNGRQRLELARTGLDAALEQARIGRIEYENGRTTAFELVRLGADVASAQQRYSDALVRTAKAAAELARLAPEAPPAGTEER